METQLVAHYLELAKLGFHYLLSTCSSGSFCSTTDSETTSQLFFFSFFSEQLLDLLNFVARLDRHRHVRCLDAFSKLSWGAWAWPRGGAGGWTLQLGVDVRPAVADATQQHLAASAVRTHITTVGPGRGRLWYTADVFYYPLRMNLCVITPIKIY